MINPTYQSTLVHRQEVNGCLCSDTLVTWADQWNTIYNY
ncbi:hypothetical protein LINPERPRIM_LOCUS8929 [Linum perenne]